MARHCLTAAVGEIWLQTEWKARELVETSLAIKCPSVDYQLVGTKKVQQVLADPKVLARFCRPNDVELLSKCMAGIWALGGEADEVAKAERQKAIANPNNYVVKPQREGCCHLTWWLKTHLFLWLNCACTCDVKVVATTSMVMTCVVCWRYGLLSTILVVHHRLEVEVWWHFCLRRKLTRS